MAKKKVTEQPAKKDWPPVRWSDDPPDKPQKMIKRYLHKPQKMIKRYLPKWDEQELIGALAGLSGMSQELAEQIAKDSDRPDNAAELAEKYKLSEMDAEAVLAVLNA